jgi:H+/Cl- antiporter ClcA
VGAGGLLISRAFTLTANERRMLLMGGAAAMAATFNTPIAAILLSVALLLFELKPRSLIPVALACAVAVALRFYLLGSGPRFALPEALALDSLGLISATACGLLVGIVSFILTWSVYAGEDGFQKLTIHWM